MSGGRALIETPVRTAHQTTSRCPSSQDDGPDSVVQLVHPGCVRCRPAHPLDDFELADQWQDGDRWFAQLDNMSGRVQRRTKRNAGRTRMSVTG